LLRVSTRSTPRFLMPARSPLNRSSVCPVSDFSMISASAAAFSFGFPFRTAHATSRPSASGNRRTMRSS
jgi:hypothetical protein